MENTNLNEKENEQVQLSSEDKIRIVKGMLLLFLFSTMIVASLAYYNAPNVNPNLVFESFHNSDAVVPRRIFGPISDSNGLYVEAGFLTLVIGDISFSVSYLSVVMRNVGGLVHERALVLKRLLNLLTLRHLLISSVAHGSLVRKLHGKVVILIGILIVIVTSVRDEGA